MNTMPLIFFYVGVGCGFFSGAILFFPAFKASFRAATNLKRFYCLIVCGFFWPFVLWAEWDEKKFNEPR